MSTRCSADDHARRARRALRPAGVAGREWARCSAAVVLAVIYRRARASRELEEAEQILAESFNEDTDI